jgi:hypothetical protein
MYIYFPLDSGDKIIFITRERLNAANRNFSKFRNAL